MRTLLAYALVVLVVASVAVQAQAPAGGEFRVSSATAVGDSMPAVAGDARGEFVVTWIDRTLVGRVKTRRYDAQGAPRGSQLTVATSSVYFPAHAVAADERGRTMMVWESLEDFDYDIHGRPFDGSGAPVGSEFIVASGAGRSRDPAVAAARGGTFVVAWTEIGADVVVLARRFSHAGNPLGSQFMVNASTAGSHPSVATDEAGGFVVVWSGSSDGVTAELLGRRFDAAGVPLGSEFRVNTYTTGHHEDPQVMIGDRGAFVVIWRDRQQPDETTIVGRRFDASGVPLGAEFTVGAFAPSLYIYQPSVAADRTGNFTVVWQLPDGSSNGVFGRRFTAEGVPRGAQFRINTFTTSQQWFPSVGADASGNLFAAWESDQDGVVPEIYAQRFGGLLPAGLGVTDGANGVLEIGESFTLDTAWRNASGATQVFQGRASAFELPPDLVGTLSPDAAYGTVANGTVASCVGPCFAGQVTGARPPGHVDGTFVETIVPDVQGQTKRWRLHVGDSFNDVPRSSTFYRFVETLLHREVTGGCGVSLFCPQDSTTRAQMAVFLLLAKEAAGYLPPACGTPIFNDVPASSPFCRWIEELARRGITGGCGGNNYCPTQAVSREQMAVLVLRTLDPTLNPPACTVPMFGDVPATSPFCRWIEELARRGVVSGCGGGNYCPADPVTRAQMSVFLSVTFGLTLYGP